jgi:hypothetical protein
MTVKSDILARFSDEADGRPFYMPDLTLWYDWHVKRGTLPDKWSGYSLVRVARAMGVPIWLPAQPWRVETPGVEVVTTEQENERVIRAETSRGRLISRWIVGPDGDWWQSEYPVKTEDDLAAALELVEARTYVLDTARLAQMESEVGRDGVLALELPRRPYSDILHQFLGWSEGLIFLGEAAIPQINQILETKLQKLVEQVAELPGQVVLSPDNLDGQFISPPAFDKYLADSYQRSAEILHQHHKKLVVHIGGPIRHILPALAEAGVDGVEGIAGPPQSDLTLTEARELVGPTLTLWGGISQDYLLDQHSQPAFEQAIRQAVAEAGQDNRIILGIADRMPVDAEQDRLEALPGLIKKEEKNV